MCMLLAFDVFDCGSDKERTTRLSAHIEHDVSDEASVVLSPRNSYLWHEVIVEDQKSGGSLWLDESV